MAELNGGYVLVDASGIELTETDPQDVAGIWDKAVKAVAAQKPIIACGCTYSTAPVSPVTGFAWYLASDEIVFVGATLHVHIKNNNKVTVLDVAGS